MGDVIANIAGGFLDRQAAKEQASALRRAGNKASGFLEPFSATGVAANQARADALGLGADPGAQDLAFQNFQNSLGFQSQLRAGNQAITSSAASRGLLNSGATAKALTRFGQDLSSQQFNNFLSQLGQTAALGAGTAQGQANAILGSATNAAQAAREGSNAFTQGLGAAHESAQNLALQIFAPGGPLPV